MIRAYARVVGVVLVSLGLWHFLGGADAPGGTSVYHAGLGALFAYVGFFQRDEITVRRVVGGLGLLILLVKVVIILAPLLWAEVLLWGPIEVTCLVVGVLSILAARFLPDSGSLGEN